MQWGVKGVWLFIQCIFCITVVSFLNCFPPVSKILLLTILYWPESSKSFQICPWHIMVLVNIAYLLEYLLRKARETHVDIPLLIISITTQKAISLSDEQNKLVESSQKLVKWVCPGLWVRYRSPGLIEVIRLQCVVVIKILFLQPRGSTSATYVTAEK